MDSRRPSLFDRTLRLVTDVRPGEGATAVLLALNIFLVLAAYYVIKPVREALLGEGAGTSGKAYMYAAIVLLLAAVVPLYGRVANRMPRRRLINVVTVFFAANLILFFIVFQLGIPLFAQGVVFFLWVSIFNVMVIAQFWAFANDVYSREEGERLFPIVAFGASFGAVMGSVISGAAISLFGIYWPLMVAAAILVASLAVTNYVDNRERRVKEADLPSSLTTGAVPAASQEIPVAEIRAALSGEIDVRDVQRTLTGEISVADVRRAMEEDEGPTAETRDVKAELEETARGVDLAGAESPFRMVLRCRYLLMIGFLMMLLNWVNTGGELILTDVVNEAAETAVAAGRAGGLTVGEYIGTFWAGFFGGVNLLGLMLQLFVVSRIVKYLGVGFALLILPVISLGAYSLIAFYPILVYVRWAKTAENATDYSLQNTVRNMLFLPCTREQKYKAKQVVDSFFHRAGDVLVSVTFFIGTTFLTMETRHFALFNIGLVVFWLMLATLIGRQYRRLVATGRPPCVG
ncbi:MAG: MFS transporter [Gemmatimonadales bacterium]